MQHVTTVTETKVRHFYKVIPELREETYTEERQVFHWTCDICGGDAKESDVTVGNSLVEFDICNGCWPALAEWISSHRGAEPRETEEIPW